MNGSSEFRADVNGLRGIAIALVLGYHFRIPPLSGGYLGVDCFFVISGFLMTKMILGPLDAGRFSLADFWMARARRIIPALAAMLLLLLAFGSVFLEPLTYKDLARSAAYASEFLSDWKFALSSGYFDAAPESNWLLHTWSLSAEWQFYMLYPVLCVAMSRIRAVWTRRGLWFVTIAAVSFAIDVTLVAAGGRWSIFGFFLLPGRAWEMLAGGFVYLIGVSRPAQWTPAGRLYVQTIGLAAIAIPAVLLDEFSVWPSYNALIPVTGTALIILADARSKSVLSLWPLQGLGTLSYSVYLWHWPMVAAHWYFGHGSGVFIPIALIGLSIAAGWASYRLVETPFRTWMRGPQRGRKALYALMPASVCALAVGITLAEGFPARARGSMAALADPTAAPQDWGYPVSCVRSQSPVQICRNPSQKPEVIFFGDSHAEMWFPRYENDRHVGFISRGGCPPIPTVERRSQGMGCRDFHRQALELISDPAVKRVLYVAYWDDYFNPDTPKLCLGTSGACTPVRSDAQIEAVLDGLFREIADLRKSGKEVAVVLPIPAPDADVPRALRIAAFRGGEATSSVPPKSVRHHQDAIVNGLRRAGQYGAVVIDPEPYMCSGQRCPVVDEAGSSLYKDGHHLRPGVVRGRFGFLDGFVSGRTP